MRERSTTLYRQATVKDDPADTPPSASHLPDDTTVRAQNQDPHKDSEQPETGVEQTTEGGGAFSRPAQWHLDGADVTFKQKENGDYHTTNSPRGPSVPATMSGKCLPGTDVLDFDQTSIFVPGYTTDGSIVTQKEEETYWLANVDSARGVLEKDDGTVAWGGIVDDVKDGVPTNITRGKSKHCFTFSTFSHRPDDGPK